jgi:enoyl-CoA hydratase/carnithine racemase
MDFGGDDEILFETVGHVGIVTLNRPKALNAVSHKMVNALWRALNAWQDDENIRLVLIRAVGRAFSAGGDIVDVYEAGKAGEVPVAFFADEYRLNALIHRFAKPYVALIDGIVMGGGFGVSFHGSHRVLTENAVFAMPEVGIGFFPDVGGSHILPRLAGSFGLYLGLTGNRIRYGDALACGLATHTIRAADQQELTDALLAGGDPDRVLARFHVPVAGETDAGTLAAIRRHFGADSLEAIVASLEKAGASDEFAARTLATMRSRSPTSVKVAWRQITAGAALSMDECMRMEFRILNRMLAGHDFYEGIRAALIDKGSPPRWQPSTLDAVGKSAVDAYFAPLGEGELSL